jgi:hypothetical protein
MQGAGGLLPQFMNPAGAQGYQQAGQRAGGMLGGAAGQTFGAGGALNAAALGGLPALQRIMQMGFDPQNALYDRTLQQTREQTGAGLSQMGLTGSGAGGGLMSDALRNFNIDWQNQQLGRGLQGLAGFGQGLGNIGSGLQQGAGLQGLGAQQALSSGQIPYQAGQDILGGRASGLANFAQLMGAGGDLGSQAVQRQLQAGMLPYQAGQTAMGGQQQALANFLSSFGAGQGLGQQNLGSMLGYMGQGLQANQLANNIASGALSNVGQQNLAATQAFSPLISSGLSGIGTGLQSLFNLFGSDPSSVIPSGNPLYTGGYSGGLGAGTTFTGADY